MKLPRKTKKKSHPASAMFDFSTLSFLWRDMPTEQEVQDYMNQHARRAASLFGIGGCLGGLHESDIIVDAHEENFAFMPSSEWASFIDRSGAKRAPAGTRLSIAERAENFVQIMLGLSSPEWFFFSRGYIATAGAAGRQTIDYIEGRGYPWRHLMGEEKYDEAISMILATLKESSNPAEAIGLNSDLGVCYASLGKHRLALRAYRESLRAWEELEGDDEEKQSGMALVRYNAMKAALRAKDGNSAAEFSEAIIFAADAGVSIDPNFLGEAIFYRKEVASSGRGHISRGLGKEITEAIDRLGRE